MDVKQVTDGLLIDEEGRARAPASVEGDLAGGNGGGTWICRWKECCQSFGALDSLVQHVQTVHVTPLSKEFHICDWEGCPRQGQRQATRPSLISHIRGHTGERPHVCSHPDCDKTFTRAEALIKHLRVDHETMISTIPRTAETSIPNPLDPPAEPEPLISSFDPKKRAAEAKRQSRGRQKNIDSELMEDEDLLDRIAPIRGRQPFWSTSEADLRTVAAIRKRYPHQQPVYFKGRLQLNDSDDDFDEGVAAGYPKVPTVVDEIKEEGAVSQVFSRRRWQVRYMMAKAKFMLVTEENNMRREELKALMRQEQDLLAQAGSS